MFIRFALFLLLSSLCGPGENGGRWCVRFFYSFLNLLSLSGCRDYLVFHFPLTPFPPLPLGLSISRPQAGLMHLAWPYLPSMFLCFGESVGSPRPRSGSLPVRRFPFFDQPPPGKTNGNHPDDNNG